eukprot:scaffold88397_cov30-Phaeocystis_antarctica.AAC.1
MEQEGWLVLVQSEARLGVGTPTSAPSKRAAAGAAGSAGTARAANTRNEAAAVEPPRSPAFRQEAMREGAAASLAP